MWFRRFFIVTRALVVSASLGDRSLSQEVRKAKIEEILDTLEANVTALAEKVEDLYTKRCDNINTCNSSNFDQCQSAFGTCSSSGSDTDYTPVCGSSNCGAIVENSTSAVSTGIDEFNPSDGRMIESICFAREIDSWLIDLLSNQSTLWDEKFGTRPSAYFFASTTGSFRSYPARPGEDCIYFDPRVRPWYMAATSGAKNVVLILDTSDSMQGAGRIKDLSWAAVQVLDELRYYDFVSIVVLNSEPRVLTDSPSFFMVDDVKKSVLGPLLKSLKDEKKSGKPDFLKAFDLALKVLEGSGAMGDCHSAILFVTSSSMNDTEAQENLVGEVKRRIDAIQNSRSQSVQFFAYSLADLENTTEKRVHDLPKKLACALDHGFWKRIDEEQDMRVELSSYVNFYSWGLGGRNDRDPSWVQPYSFATSGVLGTTVSLPVFNAATNFLGVVGIDLGLDPLFRALGGTIDDFMSRENEIQGCPTLRLEECKVDAYRKLGGLTCENTTNCSGIQVQDSLCENATYPPNLWKNLDLTKYDYKNRACCFLADSNPSDQCTVANKRAELIAIATPVPVSAPTVARSQEGEWERWGFILAVVLAVPALLGGIVSVIFIVDRVRNGRRSKNEEHIPDDYESDEGHNFRSDIAP